MYSLRYALQLQEYVRVASHHGSFVAWQQPRIIIYFPFLQGISSDVKADIKRLGALPFIGPTLDLSTLNLVPPPPQHANFDATSLCALVSQLTNAEFPDGCLEAWSHGNIHWEQCYRQVRPCILDGRWHSAYVLYVSSLSGFNPT